MSLSPPAGWPSIEGMQVSSHTNGQGLRLLTFRFETAKRPPKAGVVLVHGVGVGCRHEFLRATFKGGPHARYEGSILQVLRDAGITVLTYDQQSLGDSQPVLEGKRCYFHRFDDLAHDLLGIHEEFAASLPAGTPIFWLGLSMGGGVVTRAAQLRPPSASPLEGLVLLAPMISLTKVRQEYFFKPLGLRNQHLYGVMHQLSALFPTLPLAKRAINTVHPHMEEELVNEPTNWTQPFRIRVATECTIITEAFMEEGGEASLEHVKVPNLLAIHSKVDTFVEPLGSVAVFERADIAANRSLVLMGGGPDGPNGELRQEGPPRAAAALGKITDLGMWHALAVEPRCDEVATAIAEWLTAVSHARK